jgi:tetraacyldisaccharide 4'-kinase
MLKKSRYILIPFSFLYGLIIRGRNRLFDKNILRSAGFDFPLICVGNLAAGGTGKTPMVEYLVKILKEKYIVATLSRGYKRKTKGFLIADEHTKTFETGDEPMQIHQKFPGITVAVAEERIMGIPQVLNDKPATDVIILDDAFQHREVNAGLNILLTDYNHRYTHDLLLPAGNLRDTKSSSKRADIIIVTKCPENLMEDEKNQIVSELKPLPRQKVYFAKIVYKNPYHLFSKKEIVLVGNNDVLLVSGIANPRPMEELLKDKVSAYQLMKYKDHYDFHSGDIKQITGRFSEIKNSEKIILTTEKDAVRLLKFKNEIENLPFYVLPMEHEFLFDEGRAFENEVIQFVELFRKDQSETPFKDVLR